MPPPSGGGGASKSSALADVTEVTTTGSDLAYSFSVTVKSPDLGCEQYANWWEVLTPDGELLYRRILAHSHVDEQPFTRSGGPVAVSAEDALVIRAHMHPDGYGGAELRGSIAGGFETAPASTFDAAVEQAEPQPSGCAF